MITFKEHFLKESGVMGEVLPYSKGKRGIRWTRKGGDLRGAPRNVVGNFDCNSCKLDSLEGGPHSVTGFFDCTDNQIETLKGAPKKTGGYFGCSGNHLLDLEGAPQEVGGDFYCTGCTLDSLEGAPPVLPDGAFHCSHNPLTSLKGIPKAAHYDLPDGFKQADAEKEVQRRELVQGLDKETASTFGDFVAEL